ncbi:hypothetical protein BH09SUM1_BH09SUM1_18340 [soil metagenome]
MRTRILLTMFLLVSAATARAQIGGYIGGRYGDGERAKPTDSTQTVPAEEMSVTVSSDSRNLSLGDPVGLSVTTEADAEIFVFATGDDGVTRQLLPNYFDRDNRTHAGQAKRLPSTRYTLVANGTGWSTVYVFAASTKIGTWSAPSRFRKYDRSNPFPIISGGAQQASSDLRRGIPGASSVTDTTTASGTITRRGENAPGDALPRWGDAYTRIFVRRPDGVYNGGYRDSYDDYPNNRYTPYSSNRRPRASADAGTMSFSSSPNRAEVYVDRYYYGQTPITVRVSPGIHDVAMFKNGYETWEKNVRLEANGAERYSVRLEQN